MPNSGFDEGAFSRPFTLTSPEFSAMKLVTADRLSQVELDQLARTQVVVNPNTSWGDVDLTLRNAVVKAAYELGCVLYMSAGKEGGHADKSFHRIGKAVDISKVNGRAFRDMKEAERHVVSRAVSMAIMRGLPKDRYAELFSPGFSSRADKVKRLDELIEIHRNHHDHIHISIR